MAPGSVAPAPGARNTGAAWFVGVSAAVVGALLITGALARWWQILGLDPASYRLAGTGLVLPSGAGTTHPLGWFLLVEGAVLIASALLAFYRPWITAAVTAAGGVAALVVVLIGGWYRPWNVVGSSLVQIGAEGTDSIEEFFATMPAGWGLILTTVAAALGVVAGVTGLLLTAGRRRPLVTLGALALGGAVGVLALAIGAWSLEDEVPVNVIGLSVSDEASRVLTGDAGSDRSGW